MDISFGGNTIQPSILPKLPTHPLFQPKSLESEFSAESYRGRQGTQPLVASPGATLLCDTTRRNNKLCERGGIFQFLFIQQVFTFCVAQSGYSGRPASPGYTSMAPFG